MKKQKDTKNKTLNNIIEQTGYTIKQFCKEANIAQSTLYYYLRGQREPSVKNLLSISKTLKISLKKACELLGKDVTGIPNDEN